MKIEFLFFFLFSLSTTIRSETHNVNISELADAYIDLVGLVYKDFQYVPLADIKTEDFSFQTISLRNMKGLKRTGPATTWLSTDYQTVVTQVVIGFEEPLVLGVFEFRAPYLFVEGNGVMKNVEFQINKIAFNIRQATHVSEHPGYGVPLVNCKFDFGFEILEMLDVKLIAPNNSTYDGRDVSQFFDKTVKFAANEQLFQKPINYTQSTCLPFSQAFWKFFY